MNYTLDNFPKDMLSEIFSHLSFEDLLKSYAPNKHWTESLRTEITKRLNDGVLKEDKYYLNDLRILGKTYPIIVKSVIAEIYRRLNHNYLKDLFEKYPNAFWNYHSLSQNPNITIQDVLKHPQIPWEYFYLSENPGITLQDVLNNPQIPWNHSILSKNPNITMQDVLKHPEISWGYTLSKNPNITMQDVLNHPKYPWSYWELSKHPNITLHDVLNHPEKSWYYKYLSENPNITLQDVLKHPEIPWDYGNLLENPNITMQDVLKHPELPWKYDNLLSNPNITKQDVLDNPQILWDFNHYQWTLNIVKQDGPYNPEKEWPYDAQQINAISMLFNEEFSKDPKYIQVAHKIITELSINYLNYVNSRNFGKVPIHINGEISELTPEQIYGLVVGLHSINKLDQNPITFWDIPINIKNVKAFFGTPIRDTKYLIYVDNKPHHFATLDFMSGIKSSGKFVRNYYEK